MKPWSWGSLMRKIFVKTSKKTGGVCEILWAGQQAQVTPQELKPTLNMFRGQQFPKCFKELLSYAILSLKAQEGDVEAEKELTLTHWRWNHEVKD